MQFDPVRRLAGGSIDHDFYRHRAAVIRAETIRSLVGSGRSAGHLLLMATGLAVVLAWLGQVPNDGTVGSPMQSASAEKW